MNQRIPYLVFGTIALGLSAIPFMARSVSVEEPRQATVADIMSEIQQPAMKRLTAAIKTAPADDDGWDELRAAAALLNESGFILNEGGRAKDDVWKNSSAELRAATAGIVEAAKAKNFDAAKGLVPKVGASCKTCHDAHK